MIAGFTAHVLNTPVNVIETWPVDKALSYFQTAQDIFKLTKAEP